MTDQPQPERQQIPDPPDLDAYNTLFLAGSGITGHGITGVAQKFPCPFCAQPGWAEIKILDFKTAITEVRVCTNCLRSACGRITPTAGGATIEMLQAGGDPPPDYLPPMNRIDL